MEQQFSVEYTGSRKLYNEFGYIHVKRQKAWAVMLICVIVLMVLAVVRVVFDGKLHVTTLIPTVIFYFMWLFSDYYTGAISYSAANKATRGDPVRLVFSENEMTSETRTSSSKIAYPSFIDGFESDNLFALYNSKLTAFIVPKAGFTEGTVDDFRAFISEKIGTVRRVQRSKRRRILGIVLGVCFVLAMVGGFFAYRWWNNRLVTFESEPYSIRLPAYFHQGKEEGYPFVANTKDVYISVASTSKQELPDKGLTGIETLADYTEYFESVFDVNSGEKRTLENGTVCYTYTVDWGNDETYYYCDAFSESDDAFWVTEFYCYTTTQEKYAPLFYEWAGTIQIAD